MEPKEAGARWQSGVPRSRFLGGFFLSAPALQSSFRSPPVLFDHFHLPLHLPRQGERISAPPRPAYEEAERSDGRRIGWASRPKKSWLPCAAGNGLKSANSGNSTPRPTAGSTTPSCPSPCSICSMIAAASSPAPRFMSANCCCTTSTSCPPPSWLTAALSRFMSITTVSFSPTTPTP